MSATAALDRLAMRARPEGTPVMHQNWENLLFLHWPIESDIIRSFIPPELEIDTLDNKAWLGITPFALTGLRVTALPPIPGLTSFDELNVRTYVHYHGIPGIWFFSLDASKVIPAVAARLFFMLPYFKAHIDFWQTAGQFSFDLKRTAAPDAHFRASWRAGIRLRDPDLESLAFFLVERYCYFVVQDTKVYMTRIYHHPWILDEATVESCDSTMAAAAGIPEPTGTPVAYFSRTQSVEIWPPTALG
jgi:uncharacterized protein